MSVSIHYPRLFTRTQNKKKKHMPVEDMGKAGEIGGMQVPGGGRDPPLLLSLCSSADTNALFPFSFLRRFHAVADSAL